MSSKLAFDVGENYKGKKIRDFLKNDARLSGRLIKSAARDGRIAVNGNIVKLNYILNLCDKVTFEVEKKESQNIEPENIPIEIVYEDDDIIVVNKQPGMVVHPTKSYPTGTLANGLLYYFMSTKQNCIVRLVSRLDMDTSGLILVAKNQFSHMSLARDMREEGFEKRYIAIVHGNMLKKEGTIDLAIYRPEGSDIRRIVDERGQRSITHYSVIESYKNADMVELILETGRTHQIRVHMKHLGHPLFGDSLYGQEEPEYIKRQALHAYRLSFPHPRDGKILKFQVEIPQDMKELIKKMKDNG